MASEHKIQTHQEREFSSGILSVTTTYRLLITGDTDLKELDRLIRILTLQKQILEEAEDDIKLGTGSESATGLAQCATSSPARELSDEPLSE